MDVWLIINHKAIDAALRYTVFGNRAKAIAFAQGLGFKGDWSEQVGFETTYDHQFTHVTIIRLNAR